MLVLFAVATLGLSGFAAWFFFGGPEDDPTRVKLAAEMAELEAAPLATAAWGALRGVDDVERMTEAGLVPADTVHALWEQKSRMDAVFDAGKAKAYYTVRAALLGEPAPARFWNRAGTKLDEVLAATGLLAPGSVDRFENLFFIDLCGGPGSFAQVLFNHMPAADGAGITLESPGVEPHSRWYSKLASCDQFTPVRGPHPTSTGDILVEDNINELAKVAAANGLANIVVADGLLKAPSGTQHKENLEELFCARIIVAQLVAMFRTLRPGGAFVLRLSDVFSEFTISVVFVLAQVFDAVRIVKPPSSRIVSSERYAVCTGRKLESDELAFWASRATAVYRAATPFVLSTALVDQKKGPLLEFSPLSSPQKRLFK